MKLNMLADCEAVMMMMMVMKMTAPSVEGIINS